MAADAKYGPILAAVDPDLRRFRARGGKLIQYHGWDDQLISPLFSIEYYESVVARDASRGVQEFYRLYMVPGLGHCGGGPSPSLFDMETALEAWVERGVAPDSVIATHYSNGQPHRTRPLCPYPKVAAYKGNGDVDVAASFECREGKQ
jgi:feruloyl esterase